MDVWGSLTNSCEMKGSKKQRRKGKIYPFECRVCSNSCPLSQWCHPVISAPVIPYSFCLQSFPASESFRMSQLFSSAGQSIGVSASASNECSWLISFRTDWFDLLAVQGTLKNLLQHHNSKVSILQFSDLFIVQLSHLYMIIGSSHASLSST